MKESSVPGAGNFLYSFSKSICYRFFSISICLPVFIILQGCFSSQIMEPTDHRELRFITLAGKVPIIDVRINGKKAWMIVDTGATVTVLNSNDARQYGFSVSSHASRTTEGTGLGGSFNLYETESCTIEIGQLSIKHYPKAQDLYRLLSMIQEHERIKVAGILGADLLFKYRISINYDSKTISYPLFLENKRGAEIFTEDEHSILCPEGI